MSRTGCFLYLLLLMDTCKVWGNAPSLCLNLTIKSQSRPGQPWCEAQGSVDEKPFLHYDCDNNKATPLGPLGEKVFATKAWTDLTGMLREVGIDLRMILSDLKLEKNMTKGPHILQAQLSCQREAQRDTGAAWEFNINKQRTLFFDAMNGKWSATNPEAKGIKEEWEKDFDLAKHLTKISMGDCSQWLRNFLRLWGKMLEPTVPPLEIQITNKDTWIVIVIIVIVIIIIIFFLVFFFVTKKRGRRSGTTRERRHLQI